MHVVQFLQAFFFAPHVEVIETPLPDAPGPVKMDGGRESQAIQHLAAPGMMLVLAQTPQNENRRPLLEALHDLGRVGWLARPDQQVKVLGHEDVAEDFEAQAQAQLCERLHEVASKAVRVENARPPVSAGGKIMQVVGTVVVTLPRHASILNRQSHTCHKTACMRHPDCYR